MKVEPPQSPPEMPGGTTESSQNELVTPQNEPAAPQNEPGTPLNEPETPKNVPEVTENSPEVPLSPVDEANMAKMVADADKCGDSKVRLSRLSTPKSPEEKCLFSVYRFCLPKYSPL